ncbi:MAG: cell division protein SepF [Actinomycetota bacterium]
MAGVWRKTMKYLGLVDDDEFEAIERDGQDLDDRMLARPRVEESPLRRFGRGDHGATSMTETPEAIIRTIPKTQPSAGAIHRAEPKRFNEARELGERFKDGVPVIMNLQGTEDSIARRLVDFASGLVFAQNGKIELVAQRVYLLTPADVEVSAEERERIKEGGFYNQF